MKTTMLICLFVSSVFLLGQPGGVNSSSESHESPLVLSRSRRSPLFFGALRRLGANIARQSRINAARNEAIRRQGASREIFETEQELYRLRNRRFRPGFFGNIQRFFNRGSIGARENDLSNLRRCGEKCCNYCYQSIDDMQNNRPRTCCS